MTDTQPGELGPTVPCRSCGAPMYWATRPDSGKAIPLDPLPVANGNIRLEQTELGLMAIYDRAGEGPHYVSHFATCPNAKQHRKR